MSRPPSWLADVDEPIRPLEGPDERAPDVVRAGSVALDPAPSVAEPPAEVVVDTPKPTRRPSLLERAKTARPRGAVAVPVPEPGPGPYPELGPLPTPDAAVPGPRRRPRPRVRRVTRVVRRVDAWSVFKVAVVFWFTVYLVCLMAGALLWSVLTSTGTLDNVEAFITKTFALDSFAFDGVKVFESSALLGLVLVIAGTAATVTMAVFFNLISDLTGGVRVTVLEEEIRLVDPAPPVGEGRRVD